MGWGVAVDYGGVTGGGGGGGNGGTSSEAAEGSALSIKDAQGRSGEKFCTKRAFYCKTVKLFT